MAMVGCTFSDRPTTCSLTWLKFWGTLAGGLEFSVSPVSRARSQVGKRRAVARRLFGAPEGAC
jgi:hypothetical protein